MDVAISFEVSSYYCNTKLEIVAAIDCLATDWTLHDSTDCGSYLYYNYLNYLNLQSSLLAEFNEVMNEWMGGWMDNDRCRIAPIKRPGEAEACLQRFFKFIRERYKKQNAKTATSTPESTTG